MWPRIPVNFQCKPKFTMETLIPGGAQHLRSLSLLMGTVCPTSGTGPNAASPPLTVSDISNCCCFCAVSTALLLQQTISSSQKPWGTNMITSSAILCNTLVWHLALWTARCAHPHFCQAPGDTRTQPHSSTKPLDRARWTPPKAFLTSCQSSTLWPCCAPLSFL